MSLHNKIHGIFHLFNSSMFLIILILGILSIPILYFKNEYSYLENYFYIMSFFVVSTLIFFICYWFIYKRTHGGGIKQFFKYCGMFFVFFSIAMGFSLHNSVAVIEGLIGKRSDFIRTPKFNINSIKDSYKNNKYLSSVFDPKIIVEGLLMLYFGFGLYSAFVVGGSYGDFGLFPFHLMLFLGFGFVFFQSIRAKLN